VWREEEEEEEEEEEAAFQFRSLIMKLVLQMQALPHS
jgi:hypothetical protein